MTRGLLAGVFFGGLVAALILAVAALQLEVRRQPEPIIMIAPEVMVVLGASLADDRDLLSGEAPVDLPPADLRWLSEMPRQAQSLTSARGFLLSSELVLSDEWLNVPMPDDRAPLDVTTELEVASPDLESDTDTLSVPQTPSIEAPATSGLQRSAETVGTQALPSDAPVPQLAPFSPQTGLAEIEPETQALPETPFESVVAPSLIGEQDTTREALRAETAASVAPRFDMSLPPPADLFEGPQKAVVDLANIDASSGLMAIVVRTSPAAVDTLPEWVQSVSFEPEAVSQAIIGVPVALEILPAIAPGADRGALSALAWDMARLSRSGPMILGQPLANEQAARDLAGLLSVSGAGLLLEGELAEFPAFEESEISVARTYPAAPTTERLNRAKIHAMRDGAVILVVNDDETTRKEVSDWLNSGAAQEVTLVEAAQALARLQ